MRFVVKREEDKTEKIGSRLTYLSLLEIAKTGNKQLISDSIYRDSYDTPDGKRSHVEDKLALAYKNKCAYCERLCKADIEHYRPKKEVKDDLTHPGYYWLCYEWSNLIPSCITCNREGAKHSKFPIMGLRVIQPKILSDGNLDLLQCKASSAPLVDERPYLLHPEVDKPEDYFSFELDPNGEGIRIVGIDIENRGDHTIQICLLNRLEIKLDRVERVIDDFKDSIHCVFSQVEGSIITEEQFRDKLIQQIQLLREYSLSEAKTHTLLRQYIVKSSHNFEKLVLPFLNKKVRQIVLEAFKSVEPI